MQQTAQILADKTAGLRPENHSLQHLHRGCEFPNIQAFCKVQLCILMFNVIEVYSYSFVCVLCARVCV